MKKIEIKTIFIRKKSGEDLCVDGWVKFNRDNGKIIFLEINDGTTINNLQVICKQENLCNFEQIKNYKFSSAIRVFGDLKQTNNQKTPWEILAKKIVFLKQASDFPVQNKQQTNEFLRNIAHLRIRTNFQQAIMKIRSELAFSIHDFFHRKGFSYIATPILTNNDCEGAGENFKIVDDKNNPFFPTTAALTVSGQLNAEAMSMGLKKVYTFGPTFRAEKSHTHRHLAEFWMIEPEIAFCNLKDLMKIIEQMFKVIIKKTINKCQDEFNYLAQKTQKNMIATLQKLITSKFIKLPYKKAIDILKDACAKGHKFFDCDIFFGKDLAAEHEKYLCEVYFNAPIFLYDFPSEIKAFYMKQNKDNKTVAAVDLLVPGVGEIVGGSQREDDYEKIIEKCHQKNISTQPLQWYLDLRKYGYYKSAGFGLGFERILMFITGVDNIKDVIPFPRYEGYLKY